MFRKILSIVIISSVTAIEIGPLVIELPSGKIQGHELKSTNKNTFYAFQEIPFAAPPVGNLRFKEPVEPKPWTGTLSTTKNTKICYQQGTSLTPNVVQTEDCLYLNVYTPVNPLLKSESPLPVLFWIFGGSFKSGDGTYQLYGPGHFMDYNVIVVTINYRLGPLGFLTTEDGVIPGNLGLKDQNFALKWTRDNIKLFGGDPDKITIAGQSAGAAAVGFHLLSKQSKGLFHAAILESGTAISSWARQPFAKYYAYQMGSALDRRFTESNSSQELLELLKKASASAIINANVAVTPGKENGVGAYQDIVWAPVIEDANLDGAFVVGPSEENLERGEVNQVPIMIGFTSEETMYFMRGIPNLDDFLVTFGSYFDEDLSRVISNKFDMSKENKIKAGRELRALYTNDNFRSNPGSAIKFFSDQAYSTPQSKHAELQSKYTDVYLYQYSFKGLLGGDNPTIKGVTDNVGHTEELMYLWDFHIADINTLPASEILMYDRLLTLWTNFVKYSNPTPDKNSLLENVSWSKVTPGDMTYLNINLTLTLQTNPKKYKEWQPIIDAYAIPPLYNY